MVPNKYFISVIPDKFEINCLVFGTMSLRGNEYEHKRRESQWVSVTVRLL